jgi:hypothetical protein
MQLTVDMSVTLNGEIVSGRITGSGDCSYSADVTVPGDSINLEVLLPFSQSDLTSGRLILISTQTALTVKTNSAESPDDVFEVAAGGFFDVRQLSDDIARLFVINNSESTDSILKIRAVKDATPD